MTMLPDEMLRFPTLLMLDAVSVRMFANDPTMLLLPVKKTDGQFEMEFEFIFSVPTALMVGEVKVMFAPTAVVVRAMLLLATIELPVPVELVRAAAPSLLLASTFAPETALDIWIVDPFIPMMPLFVCVGLAVVMAMSLILK
jgi:hypothetical protein